MFPDIAYIDWIVGRPERADHDLGSSDLHRAPGEPDAAVLPALAGFPAPPDDVTLEAQIAAEYGVGAESVLVTAGATHANLLAVVAALDRGGTERARRDRSAAAGRVLVEESGYEPLVATPRGLGATVDRFARPATDDYALDADRIADVLRESTVCVTVTNRHNPSGRRVGRDELAAAASVTADAGATLLVDEVYAPFGADSGEGPFGGPTAVGLPNAVVTNSLTKFFGFGDLRIGWLVADPEFVARARSMKHHVPAVAGPSRRLARRALANADELAAESRERIRANREALASFVAARDDLSGRVEPGCTYAFLAHADADVDGDAVSTAAREHGVLVVPGRFFDDPGRFRLSACQSTDIVREGLDALGEALDDCFVT